MAQKALWSLCIVVCFSMQPVHGANENVNQRFDAFKERFIIQLLKRNPEDATSLGYHVYDDALTINDKQYRLMQNQFCKQYLDSLKSYAYDDLTNNNKTDYALIENELKSTLWWLNTAREYEWNPSIYNISSSFAYILNEPYDKLESRLLTVHKKMKWVSAYYKAARSNLRAVPPELANLAIEQNNGGLSVFETDLVDSLKNSSLTPQQKQEVLKSNEMVIQAIKRFVAWLETGGIDTTRSFRLGKKLYEQKFAFDILSRYSIDELYTAALQRKEYLVNEMEKHAGSLWQKYYGNSDKPHDRYLMIRKVIDTISAKHAAPENFRQAIEEQLPRLSNFVRQKDLLYLDPSKPLKVRKEPGYMAGVAGASISAPGPFEKKGKTYYNVGSLEGWPLDKAESYLREYNDYTLQILNIHEAIPGHYVQLVYSNNSPSIIKSVLGNGSMVEGWAVYSELMMMENGYDDTPEMWLMYHKWNLRAVCNTLLDIGVHTRNMSKNEAMELLVTQAFQQQAEAEGKWKRVSVTSVQLTSYFNGFYEILQLHDAYKKKLGTKFSEKQFNETFLSYGSAPVRFIRQLMMGE